MVGAVRPSSRFLVRSMLQNIDFSKAKVIVELGPGTGVFTEEILTRMRPDAQLLVFELNETFVDYLRNQFVDERVTFIHDSAENISTHLANASLSGADYIISSLPLANFSDALRDAIVTESKRSLRKNGRFLQFQYSLQSKKYFESKFTHVHISFTLWNIPPAFVFVCTQ